MSQQLINRSDDLKRLRDEGYDIEIRSSYLLLKHVPYVNSRKEVKYGILVSDLNLAGDMTTSPGSHVAYFSGDHPCDKNGAEMVKIKHQSKQKSLDSNLIVHHSFSSKPQAGYKDYYEKMTTYATIISSPAMSLDSRVTATPFTVIESEGESVFKYIDTASSRSGINEVSRKLEIGKVGIVGLGGTGSYILDLTAKTPIGEIHLFDGDLFLTHNAFRAPGAASIGELREKQYKVDYFRHLYAKMRRNIVAHNVYVDASNVHLLHEMDFIFLCLDKGKAKRFIIDSLEETDISFIDVGIGVEHTDDTLCGIVRVTTSTAVKRDHVIGKNRIPFTDERENAYSRNIQIADLNALNAALAVVKWKKLYGFYGDLEKEHFSAYAIDGNLLINEDQREE